MEDTPPGKQVWSVWWGRERVGELEANEHTTSTRVKLWGQTKDISSWGGESPADKFQKWVVSPGADEWIEIARMRDMLLP